ncbi:hypothetical protein [Williamsia sp.]|uniref:hypothetical protein n=1 Tax=Williamsia sp. TaxID=1872085 RepID=UPI002F93154A
MNWIRNTLTTMVVAAAAAGALVIGAPAAQAAPCGPDMDRAGTASAFKFGCTQGQFDSLFRNAVAGPIPRNVVMNGGVRPIGDVDPGATDAVAALWQGKHFYNGWLNNRVLGGETVSANVFYGLSARDGKPVVRIDYARAGVPFAHDELRQLPNGVYLGYGYLNNSAFVDFWVYPA